MNVGMMGAPMMAQSAQSLQGNGPNGTNVPQGGMTTPNGGSGPTYKPNSNPGHGGNAGNSGNANVGPKKGNASVGKSEETVVMLSVQP